LVRNDHYFEGRYPLHFEASLNAIKFFTRICLNVPADSLQADALLCQLELDSLGSKCWASGVRKTLEECGYAFVWHSPHSIVSKVPSIISAIQQRLKDIYFQTFLREIHNDNKGKFAKNKLRSYRLFKSTYNEEEYLRIPNDRQRTTITKLRLSCHKLRVETGRHNRTPLEQRICQFCNMNKVEDEAHFLLDCSLYSNDRSILFSFIIGKFPRFESLSSVEKFIFLMRFDRTTLYKHISSYIFNITKKREEAEQMY